MTLCLLGWLTACAHLPDDIRPYVSDLGAMNVASGRLGPFRYIRSGSYLPGTSRSRESDHGSKLRALCEDGLLLMLQGQPAQALREVQGDICRAHHQVRRYFPSAVRLRFVSLRLVPEGVAYERQWFSAGLAPGLSLALRHFEDTAFGRRQMVRAFSHEAFHVYAGFANAPISGSLREESAATLFESCIELSVFGSALGDVVDGKNRERKIDQINTANAAARSLIGADEASRIAFGIGISFPVDQSDSKTLHRLELLCEGLTTWQ